MKKLFLLALAACCVNLIATAQTTCHTMEVVNQKRANDPVYDQGLRDMEQGLRKFVSMGAPAQGSRAVRTIPVVVHVIYNTGAQNISDAAIQAKITQMNEDYRKLNADLQQARSAVRGFAADAEIQFCLAQQTPTGQPTTGIERRQVTETCFDPDTETDKMKSSTTNGMNAWDTRYYLNFWIVALCGNTQFSGTGGYAYIPTANNGLHGSNIDGIVIDYYWGMMSGSHAWTHEVGHYLGLHHTWGDLSSNACGNVFPATDDGFSDTPDSKEANFGCTPVVSCTNNSSYGDLLEDFMDYSDCSALFTTQQVNYMNSVLSNIRGTLVNSNNRCSATGAPIAGFTASPTSICTGQTVTFTNTSTGTGNTYSWSFPGGTPATSTAANPTITYNTPGTYNVSLTATNSNGNNTSTQTNLIVVSNSSSLPLAEGFEATTFPPAGWSLNNADASTTWVRTTSASGFGTSTACAYINNYNYNAVGQKDWLITPSYNFTGVSAGRIKWDYSYAPYTQSGYSDSLEVLYSTNCGATWVSLWKRGGTGLGTATATANNFIPTSAAQWKRDSVSLAALSGQSNVRFAFKSANQYGNNIFLDNINIYNSSQTGVAPVADFVGTPTTVVAGNTVAFTDISTNSPTTWSWTFAGGTPGTSSVQNPTITYNTPGTYTVTLNASNGSGNDTETKTGYITVIQGGGQTCDTLTNTTAADTLTAYVTANGYLSGNNSFGDLAKAEFYTNAQTRQVTGAFFLFVLAKVNGTGTAQACVWDASGTGGSPGAAPLASVPINISTIIADIAVPRYTYVSFPTPPTVTGNFYLGIVLPTGTGDTVVLATTSQYSPSVGQGWEQWDDGTWHSYQSVYQIDLSNIAYPVLCSGQVAGPTASFSASSTSVCAGSTVTFTSTSSGSPTSYSWTFPGGTPSASTAQNPTVTYNTAGNYNVTLSVSNANGNNSTSQTNYIAVNPRPVLTGSSTSVLCYGGSTGSATVAVSSGTSPYTYNWSGGGSGATISNKPSGTYTVTVTDSRQCSSTTSVNIAQPLAALSLQPNTTDAVCNQQNGSASVTATGGAGGYVYHWNNNGSTATINNVAPGTYSVTVTDANNCSATSSMTVGNSSSNFSVSISAQNATCGLSNGTAVALPNNGNFGVTYVWSTGAATGSIANLSAGSYTVTVTNNVGCTASATSVITTSGSAVTVSFSITPSACSQSTGGATVSANGGSGGYTYNWSNGSIVSSISNVAAGGYAVTVTDNTGCTATGVANVSNAGAPSVTATAVNVSCFGGNNGSATVTATGGSTPYTYSWSAGGNSATVTNLTAGTYVVSVYDNAQCLAVNSVTVTQPAQLAVTLPVTNSTCGVSNGSIAVNVSGGTSPYSNTWSPNIQNTSQLSAGTYSLTVTDNNQCSVTASATVNNIAGPTSVISATNGTCQIGAQINLTVSGGTLPFTYEWSNGATTEDLVNIPAGAYSVTVTDGNTCKTTNNASVTDASNVVVAFTTQDPTGGNSNGSVTANPTGGTAPYTYNWSNGGSTATISNLASGNYTVTVTDNTGCIKISSVTIGNPNSVGGVEDVMLVRLFPNPAKDVCHVQLEMERMLDTDLMIFNELGQLVYTKHLHEFFKGIVELDVNKYAPGVYILKVQNGHGIQTLRFVKE